MQELRAKLPVRWGIGKRALQLEGTAGGSSRCKGPEVGLMVVGLPQGTRGQTGLAWRAWWGGRGSLLRVLGTQEGFGAGEAGDQFLFENPSVGTS